MMNKLSSYSSKKFQFLIKIFVHIISSHMVMHSIFIISSILKRWLMLSKYGFNCLSAERKICCFSLIASFSKIVFRRARTFLYIYLLFIVYIENHIAQLKFVYEDHWQQELNIFNVLKSHMYYINSYICLFVCPR